MLIRWMIALGMGAIAAIAPCQDSAFKSPKERQSYAFGVDVANDLRRQLMDVDPDLFNKGFKDAISGGRILLSEEEVRAAVAELQVEWKRKMAQARRGLEDGKKAGEAFLAENSNKPEVVTLPSGLQYKILKMGKGKKPTEAATVVCHYRGTFVDGTEFDSSYRTGNPGTFQLSGVIPGWREALMLMPVGSKWLLFVPPQLAYGEQGSGTQIGPNATLIFEIDLLSIK